MGGTYCLCGVVVHHFGFSFRRPGFKSRHEHLQITLNPTMLCWTLLRNCPGTSTLLSIFQVGIEQVEVGVVVVGGLLIPCDFEGVA